VLTRKSALATLVAAAFTVPLAACQRTSADTTTPALDQTAFERAVAAGGPVVVQFHAEWCPTCKQQEPIVKQILSDPKFAPFKLFVANFDSDKGAKQQLNVSTQSTFVVFKSGKEVGRSTGQTTRETIEATFAKAL
jgi:thioredoxin 1